MLYCCTPLFLNAITRPVGPGDPTDKKAFQAWKKRVSAEKSKIEKAKAAWKKKHGGAKKAGKKAAGVGKKTGPKTDAEREEERKELEESLAG